MNVVSVTRSALLVVLIAMTSALGLTANTTSSERSGTMSLIEGRRYLVAFPQVWASPTERPLSRPMQLFISSRGDAKITIRTPALVADAPRISRDLTVKKDQVLKFEVNMAYMNTESEARKGLAIEVVGNRPISVSTYQAWNGNGELARHLPVESWGKAYYTMNFYQDRYGTNNNHKLRPAQILIIANRDNTVVTYRPTYHTEGGPEAVSTPKGGTQTVTLDRGQTFLIKAKIDPVLTKDFESDLSGTFISANKPIGVVSGHTKVAIMRYPDVLPPTGAFTAEAHFVRNNVHDAMLPLEMAGREFVTIPCMYTPTRVVGQAAQDFGIDDDRGDVIRVVALEENTTVQVMRQDGSGLASKFTLRRAGDTRIDPVVEHATYWVSDKPILMGQYGKSWAKIIPPVGTSKGDGTQGHPTVESGMPMLQYVPSVDRWVNYGVFSSPEGMDNFFNIVFKMDEVGKIRVDGRPLASAFGGAMRPIRGTPYAQIRTPIGVGDHIVESTEPDVKWAAWTYGSLDGMNQGRAYGTPIAIDLAIPCDDSLAVKETIVCGDIEAQGKIFPENSTCGSIFAVYAEEMSNYELIVDEEFNSGDKDVKFWVKVLDKTKDAHARILVVSRSGKFVEKTYTYEADKLTFTPDRYNFGVIPFGEANCTKVVLTNPLDRDVRIQEIRVKYFPNIFRVTPNSAIVPAKGSVNVDVCATIQDGRERVDTLLVKFECFDLPTTELRVRGEEPKINVGDQNWGIIPANAEVRRPVVIQNAGTTPVIVRGYDRSLLDRATSNFYDPQNLDEVLPLTLQPGARHTFTVVYSPKGVADVQHRVDVPFFTNAKEYDTIATLIGQGNLSNVSVNGLSWNERVIDRVVTAAGVTSYSGRVEIANVGTGAVTVNNAEIVDDVHGVFSIRRAAGDIDLTNPVQIGQGSGTQYLTVHFTPTEKPNRAAERDDYKAAVRFTVVDNNETKTFDAELTAIAWQPQVNINVLPCESFDISGNRQYSATIRVTNEHPTASNAITNDTKGSAPLRLTNIRIVGPNPGFVIEQPVAGGDVIVGGETREYRIVINNPLVSWNGQYTVQADAAYDVNADVAICVPNEGTWEVTGDAGEVYVHHTKTLNVTLRNSTNLDKLYSISKSGPDVSAFEYNVNSIAVPAMTTVTVPVLFIPEIPSKLTGNQTMAFFNDKKTRFSDMNKAFRGEYVASIDFRDDVSGEVKSAEVRGHGLIIQTTAKIADNYRIQPGKTTDVNIEVEPTPEGIDVANVRDITIRVSFDPTIARPDLTKIRLNGTLADGWTVREAAAVGPRNIELKLSGPNALANTANKVVVVIPFEGFLGRSDDFANDPMSIVLGLDAYVLADFDGSGEEYRHIAMRSIDGKMTLELNCANVMRLTSITGASFGVAPPSPNPASSTTVINYSVGLDGHTRIVLFNSMGEKVADLVNTTLVHGQYDLTVDVSQLPAGVYYFQVVSGPFTSEPQALHIVK
jgi:hypothetical protein